jgi:hypothetical protein
MEQHSLLSPQLIQYLNSKNLFYIFHTSEISRAGFPSNNWFSSQDLALPSILTLEWNSFRHHLVGTGIQLHDAEDQPTWTGGDRSGFLSARNVYTEIANHHWPSNTGGWKNKLWTWSIPLKIKLFFWLSLDNKINTWDVLKKKGGIGPNVCHLCLQEEETVQHIFIHCDFTRAVLNYISSTLKINFSWVGSSLAILFGEFD